MSGVAGVEEKAAFKKASAWGTAVACGANNGILILPRSIKKSANVDVDNSLGNFYAKDGDLGPIAVEGVLPAYLRYDSLDALIAEFMGIAGAPTQQGGTTAYAFLYRFDTDTDGYFGTLVANMKNYIEEHPSAKIAGMSIKGEVGKPVEISFDVTSINKVYDSVVNTLVTFNNVTYFETSNRVKFSQGVFRMNDASGGALGAGNAIYPSAFEFSAKRKLKGEYDGQYKFTSGSNVQDLIDEPQNDGAPEITLKLDFPRHTAVTYLSALGADTRKKLDMTFTGGLIASSYYRQFKIEFPHLQLKNDDPADAEGIIKEQLEFNCYGATAAPTGMTYTEPFCISGINRLSTNPLA